jgi:enamine deaminase RidA (YjgF/YER057c/UK114 family)
MTRFAGIVLAGVGLHATLMTAPALAQPIERMDLEGNPGFPISAAVTVGHELDTIYLSGVLPSVRNPGATKGSTAAYGTTQEQTESALSTIRGTLAKLGLGMGDIVKMTVFLVADPNQGNKLDFAGMMASYSKYFGTAEQPAKPARSAVQVAALAAPGALVEIEVIAARSRGRKTKNP